MKRLKEILDRTRDASILDIGTGSGQFVSMIKETCNHYKSILGIDTLERAIEAANQKNEDERVSFEVRDVMDMDASFDIVCLSNSLHHFEDPYIIINKMVDLLKPGGKIIIQEMYKDFQTDKQMSHVHLHHFWAKVDRMTGNVHNDTFDKKTIIDYTSHKDLKFIDAWDVVFEDKHVFSQEDFDFLKSSIYNSLKRIEDHESYTQMKELGISIEKRLDEHGFDLATELMIVLEKC
ncbi:class I SAM-dependent methyltransferase [Acidaminobacter sp. JC074]|uniref:class I SAM-dependent methyltransferase n=1 Tax=Acidaminobacter sp. JC074 TaxID=2530199 RepID=UPI001F109318|nr:class I SAM-dependent methyltransferase [Acidaminobacter sp. JC074]